MPITRAMLEKFIEREILRVVRAQEKAQAAMADLCAKVKAKMEAGEKDGKLALAVVECCGVLKDCDSLLERLAAFRVELARRSGAARLN